jgi:hypothetical protein
LPTAPAPPKTAPCTGEGPFSAVPARPMLPDRCSTSLICRDKHPACRSRAPIRLPASCLQKTPTNSCEGAFFACPASACSRNRRSSCLSGRDKHPARPSRLLWGDRYNPEASAEE